MDDFPSNSHREREVKTEPPREEKPEVKQIVQGEVLRRKKPLGKRFKETFVGTDARSVWAFVAIDVLIPAFKDMVADATQTAVERTLFGDGRGRGRSRGRNSGGLGHFNYSSPSGSLYSSGGGSIFKPDDRRELSRRARSVFDFEEIIVESRAVAEDVIDQLFEIVSKYEQVTVADLYDTVGINSNYTDIKWGWTDIRGAKARRVRDGYVIDLPRPEELK